jgi:hypothetical protein
MTPSDSRHCADCAVLRRELYRAIETRENANAASLRIEHDRNRYAALLRDLIANTPCRCDHPLRGHLGPCAKCRAKAALDA